MGIGLPHWYSTDYGRTQIKITWQFSVQAARTKLNTHYTRVHPDNEKLKET